MRSARAALGALGVAGVAWGGWLLGDDGLDRLRSTALWLVGLVVVHDAVLAPLVVVIGVVAAKTIPTSMRAVAAVAFIVWGGLTLAVANVLAGVGGKPDIDSLLNRPYVSAWLALTGLVVVAALSAVAVRARLPRARAPQR